MQRRKAFFLLEQVCIIASCEEDIDEKTTTNLCACHVYAREETLEKGGRQAFAFGIARLVFWVYIIPGIISVYNMILIKTFIESLPASLEESAEIDGAGYLRRYFYLILPLSVPILATVLLFSIVGHWNAFMDTLLYVSDYRLFSLQYLLYEYYNNAASVAASVTAQIDQSLLDNATKVSETALKYTITMVTIIPVICVYPFVQRFYVKGMIIGAVKG